MKKSIHEKERKEHKHEPWCTEARMDSMAPDSAGSFGGPLTG